ncbi:hypothetical protein ACVJ5M_009507 [Bradyrhizobium sp. S3.7.6]
MVVLAVGPVALVVAPVLEPVPEAAELEPAAAELVQERAALAAAVLHTSNVAARVPPVLPACATRQLRLPMEPRLGADGLPIARD